MSTSLSEKPITKADRRHGYRIGCDGWATVDQAAELMGCSDRTIERRIDAGKLRAFKLDDVAKSGIRICVRSIMRFIGDREVCRTA